MRSLSVTDISISAFMYIKKHFKAMGGFALLHFAIVSAILWGAEKKADVVWGGMLLIYYLFWCFFFRFYFNRKPFVSVAKLPATVVPFTKMLFIISLLASLLFVLPLAVPFLGIGQEWAARYELLLKRYLEDTNILNAATVMILILALPVVFFRPMMAWIASIIGRSGSIGSAFLRTEGNYGKFMLLGIIFGSIASLLETLGEKMEFGYWPVAVLGTLAVIYLGVILARIYEFFFLEID